MIVFMGYRKMPSKAYLRLILKDIHIHLLHQQLMQATPCMQTNAFVDHLILMT